MKTIFQLAKIARRAINRKRLWNQRAVKAKTVNQRNECLHQIRVCEHNARWVKGQLSERNVFGDAVRSIYKPIQRRMKDQTKSAQ